MSIVCKISKEKIKAQVNIKEILPDRYEKHVFFFKMSRQIKRGFTKLKPPKVKNFVVAHSNGTILCYIPLHHKLKQL